MRHPCHAMVCCMTATPTPTRSGIRATARVRLRNDVFDAAMTQRGAETRSQQARLCDTDRTNLIRIRGGKTTPSLELAMHIASQLGMKVEELFERAD